MQVTNKQIEHGNELTVQKKVSRDVLTADCDVTLQIIPNGIRIEKIEELLMSDVRPPAILEFPSSNRSAKTENVIPTPCWKSRCKTHRKFNNCKNCICYDEVCPKCDIKTQRVFKINHLSEDSTLNDLDNWLDECLDAPAPQDPKKICGSCHFEFELVCKRCLYKQFTEANRLKKREKNTKDFHQKHGSVSRCMKRTSTKQILKKLQNVEMSEQQQIELRFKKERSMLQNKVRQLMKVSPNATWWISVEGKPMKDINEAIRCKLMYGHTMEFRVGLPGGMHNDKEDINEFEIEEINLNIPEPPPKQNPRAHALKKTDYSKILKSDHIEVKKLTGEHYAIVKNGLKIENFRNRDLYEREHVKQVKKTVKNERANWANKFVKQHNDTPKDIVHIADHSKEYAASKPFYEGDPDWKQKKDSTDFEDQLQYARYTLVKNDVRVHTFNPLSQTNVATRGIVDYVNIMMKHSLYTSNIYMPEPQDYNRKFDYACRIVDDELCIAFPYLGSYHVAVYPNNLVLMEDKYFIFNHYRIRQGEQLFVETMVEVKTKDGVLNIPKYMIEYATSKFGAKNVSGYSISTFIADFQKFWKESANSMFQEPTQEMIQSAMFYAAREKHLNLSDQLGLNYNILNVQAENVKLLANLPKFTGVYGVFRKLAELIIPPGFREIVTEMFDNWKFTGTTWIDLESIRQVFQDGVGFLFSFFWKAPSMTVFPQFSNIVSVILEELIKIIPGGGLAIAVYEIYQDYKSGSFGIFDSILRLLFHNWQELLPFWLRLASLPFRIGFHFGWNYLKDKAVKFVKKQVLNIGEDYAATYERKPEMNIDFLILDHCYRQARFPSSESVPIPDVLLQNPILEMETDDTESLQNPIYTVAASVSSNMAGMKNGNNFLNAYLKRNIQQKPLANLHWKEKYAYSALATQWKKSLIINEIDTQVWIDAPNHGPKRQLYQSAFNKFLDTGEIDYTAKLNLKLDEVVFKKLMRTICAFDNSYLVNVGPAIAEYSKALKAYFNGYNNVAKESDPFTLHILYATGMTTKEMAKVIYDNRCMVNTDKPHFFLAVLGDDTALTRGDVAMCCDFSRYDSTQHEEQHEAFREMMTCENNKQAVYHMRKAASAPTKVSHPQTGQVYKVPTTGLKTGCPETSVSNTTITAMSVYMALMDSFPDDKCEKWMTHVPKFLEERCGFLPKASIQNLVTGVEFLKNIFILQNNDVVVVPLLSSLAKIGKFLTHPRIIVPFSKLKSREQICVESVYMQLLGKGDLSKVPGFSRWLNALAKMSLTNQVYRTQYQTRFDTNEVHHETMEIAYDTRYGLDLISVLELFDNLAKLKREDYPFNYCAQILNVAVEKDYGIEF
jgi:hypothetical protein